MTRSLSPSAGWGAQSSTRRSSPAEPYPPAVDLGSDVLSQLVAEAARAVWCDAPPVDGDDITRRLRFGAQLDARPVTGGADRDAHGEGLHPETVAAYIAKYATKAAADLPTDQGRNGHLRQLQTTMQQLAGRTLVTTLHSDEEPYKGWTGWGDMLGFRDHLATKSYRYSVTLGRLRQARREHVRPRARPAGVQPEQVAEDQVDAEVETTLAVGAWRFARMGWLTAAMQPLPLPPPPALVTTEPTISSASPTSSQALGLRAGCPG